MIIENKPGNTIKEEVKLNTHQRHLEQLVSEGPDGLKEINYKLSNFINSFNDKNDNLNISTKIDGAPAVICWHHIQGYPDDSICLKSFVRGAKNALSSKEEVQAKYGKRPDMAAELMFCLDLAKKIPYDEAWQGDCLFTSNTKSEKTINGKKCIVFTPNTVTYAFSEDNPNYDKIKSAKFGICFHTIYKVSGNGLSQSFKIDPSRLDAPDDVYVMSPIMNTPNVGFDASKAEDDYRELLSLEKKLTSNSAYEELTSNEMFKVFWPMFENHITADKASNTIDANTFYKELSDFTRDKQKAAYEKKASTLKTDKGKANAKSAYESEVAELDRILSSHKDVLTDMVNVFNQVVKIKTDILSYLKSAPKDYDTYIDGNPSSGEGWSMSDQDGNIVKLVDRAEFSHANRSRDYSSHFNRESLEEATLKDLADKNRKYDEQELDKMAEWLTYFSNLYGVEECVKNIIRSLDRYGEESLDDLYTSFGADKRVFDNAMTILDDNHFIRLKRYDKNAPKTRPFYYTPSMLDAVSSNKHSYYISLINEVIDKWLLNHREKGLDNKKLADMEKINETSTSRIYKHLSDYSNCAIISAFRGDNDIDTNLNLDKELKKDVRSLGYGFVQFTSRWVEDGESFDEQSILVPNISFKEAISLGKKYNQSSIIYKDGESCKEYCTTPFEIYEPGEVVRTFNNVGPNMLNIEDAKDIFMRRKGGPASKARGAAPFNLKVIERLDAKPSMFRGPSEHVILDINEKIVKKGSKYQVQSEKGKNMGTYNTKAEARKRLGQIEYFKHANEELEEDNFDETLEEYMYSFGDIDD